MRRILPLLVTVMALACLASCNKKPRHYQMVQNMTDGKQIVEQFDAENDTVALNQYLDRMTKIIMDNMNDTAKATKIESMFVISPDGDTLNTKKELMQAIETQVLKDHTHDAAR